MKRRHALLSTAGGLLSLLAFEAHGDPPHQPSKIVMPLRQRRIPLFNPQVMISKEDHQDQDQDQDQDQGSSSSSGAASQQPYTEEVSMAQTWQAAFFATALFPGNQTIDVLVDTGSAGMGVPIKRFMPHVHGFEWVNITEADGAIVGCDDPRCRGSCSNPPEENYCGPHGGICREFNGTSACSFLWRYGDGSQAKGVLVESSVDVGGLPVRATFGGITSAAESFFETPVGGGIMGMAFTNDELLCSTPSASSTCFCTVMDTMVAQEHIEDRFSMCAWGEEGKLILGGGDDTMYEGTLQTVPMVPPYAFYQVTVNKIMLGEEDITSQLTSQADSSPAQPSLRGSEISSSVSSKGHGPASSNHVAVVDTGVQIFMLPKDSFNNFVAGVIRAAPEVRDTLLNTTLLQYSEETIAKMPSLVFHLDSGAKLEYPAGAYVKEMVLSTDEHGNVRNKARMLLVSPGPSMILGMPALNDMYVEYDRVKKTVGFAKARSGCQSQQASS